MLVLSRRLGEKIVINLPAREGRGVENITIVIMDIDRGKIRIGIDAPRDIPVYRTELLESKGEDNAKGYEGGGGRQQQGQDQGGTGPNSAGIL